MSRLLWDVAIIGGGPAGLAAALALTRGGAKVAVFDAVGNAPQGTRVETLQAQLRPALRLIGAESALQISGSIIVPSLMTIWPPAASYERPSILDPNGPAVHVDRRAFRSALAEIATAAGASLFQGSSAHATPTTGGWCVTAARQSLDASFLIVATGRDALPIAQRVPRRSVDRLVAVFSHPHRFCGVRDARLIVEAASSGWWYRCPSTCGVQIAFLSDADLVGTAAKSDWFVKILREVEVGKDIIDVGDIAKVAANTYCREAVTGDNCIIIGDAATAGDPLAGEGVNWAVSSGLDAAAILLGCAEDRASALANYSTSVVSHFVDFLRARSAVYGRETSWPRSTFWARRASV